MAIDLIDELRWRGLLHQVTDEERLRAHLAGGRRKVYIGFDPTADSLTIGNMVPIMVLIHVARAGHEPVVVMGGGTGLIGDPSGKSAERQLMTAELVQENVDSQRGIFVRMFGNAGVSEPRILNNLDWLGEMKYLEVLRDVGKHFSVNMMIQKESVKERLHNREQGISYTEFSYMILQAYDFAHLFEREGVTVQGGGSDQWGNIVAGLDLIRKEAVLGESADRYLEAREDLEEASLPAWQKEVEREQIGKDFELEQELARRTFGFTAPLVTKSDGGKFGKTESGAIWLTALNENNDSPARTSVYGMYQFWLNTSDADVIKFLKLFTLLDQDEIGRLEESHASNPGAREAQLALAVAATDLVHGRVEREYAEKAAQALFSGDVGDLALTTLEAIMSEVPSSTHARADLEGEGVGLVDLLVETQLAQSKRQAREFLQAGSVSVNGRKVGVEDRLSASDLLHESIIALRRGKKHWHATRWT